MIKKTNAKLQKNIHFSMEFFDFLLTEQTKKNLVSEKKQNRLCDN